MSNWWVSNVWLSLPFHPTNCCSCCWWICCPKGIVEREMECFAWLFPRSWLEEVKRPLKGEGWGEAICFVYQLFGNQTEWRTQHSSYSEAIMGGRIRIYIFIHQWLGEWERVVVGWYFWDWYLFPNKEGHGWVGYKGDIHSSQTLLDGEIWKLLLPSPWLVYHPT